MSLNHLSRYRSRWSFFSELFGSADGEANEPDFPADDNVEEAMLKTERCALVEQTLQELPPAQRVPLVLFHLEELGYEEIAASLGVSLSKVKTDIFRGREVLRRKLKLKFSADENAA
jgi:RNA polymerase sigma-70 factor (ECF subfamily)